VSLLIEYVDRLACPVIRCDLCGERISDARLAGVVWKVGDGDGRDWSRWGEGRATPRFLCKTNGCLSRCRWPWEELSIWLMHLIGNVGLDRPKRWRRARTLAALHAGMR
jgi:hypothetical protein